MRVVIRIVGVMVVVAVAAGLVLSLVRDTSSSDESAAAPEVTTTTLPTGSPVTEAEAYLDAWARADWPAMASLTTQPPEDFADEHTDVLDSLRAEWTTFQRGTPSITPETEATDAPPRATVPFTASMTITGLGEWSYEGELAMVGTVDGWRVDWSPATIHPAFRFDGFDLRRSRVWPVRGTIYDTNGNAIVASAAVIEVGVEPQRIEDRAVLADVLESELGITPEELDAALDDPSVQPNFFVTVAQLSDAEWNAVRDVVLPVPGVLVRNAISRTPPSDDWASHTLGRVREATAEQLEILGPPYAVGDRVGTSGLESAFERTLAGSPTGEVRLIDDFGDEVDTLATFPGSDSFDITTTIDPAIQLAAEEALAGIEEPAAIVAVGPGGKIRALVSRPVDGFHRAIGGRYPLGSTFKLVTAYALLSNGVTPETIVACPSEVVIGGRTFSNFEGGSLGDIPFSVAFRESCNTAFQGTADDIGAAALAAAADTFGFDAGYELPLDTFGGRFPEVADDTENAAAAIGQARVESSPLHLASVAAAIASGSWDAPTLMLDGTGETPVESVALDPFVTATIRALMSDVVSSGTGTAAAVPGRTMGGKTGTAQYDTNDPEATHAWFAGWVETAREPLGFAVLVEGGGVGGRVAAPIAGDFVRLLPE